MKKDEKLLSDTVRFSHKLNAVAEKIDIKHCHDDYEIVYVASGTGSYLIEGAIVDFKPGTLIFVRPFEYHCVTSGGETDYERYVLHFSRGSVQPKAKEALDKLSESKNGESGVFCSQCLNSEAILSVFDKFLDRKEASQKTTEDYLNDILSELIILVSSEKYEKISHDEFALPTRVTSYINQYILRDVSLEIISKRFFISKYYLCRMFKKHIGVTVHAYISQKRVFYAKEMIESGVTASNAAYQVGFGDYSAFYRAYVKLVGKTPSLK